MRALRKQLPEVRFIGVGGPLMREQGLETLFSYERLAVMGIVDVLKQLPDLLKARKEVIAHMLAQQPDIFVGIDAPDFNIPIETKLKQSGIVTIHYVSPSVWAWRQKRVFKIAKATHNVLCLLPFEKAFYDRFNVPAAFVGHTLADEIPIEQSRDAACDRLDLPVDTTYIGLLPGSRQSEIAMLGPAFIAAAKQLQQKHAQWQFLIPVVNEARRRQVEQLLDDADLPAGMQVSVIDGQSREVMQASSAVMLASGTVALEAMLLKRPMVVAYRFAKLNYAILRRLVKVEHFSLPNLLAGYRLVPELLQDEVTSDALSQHIENFITQPQQELIASFTDLHQAIQLNATDTAAAAVIATYAKNHL